VTDIEITAASLIHDTSYTYSVVDQITALNDAINSSLNQAFDYDLLDRLDEADGDYGDQSYSYDANGNRTQRYNATTLTTQTLTYGTGTNQLATVDSAAVVHDGAGNRTSDDGGTREYAYNHAGRMIQFTESSVVQADYVMNAEGQLVTKERHAGAATYIRHFFYDQSGLNHPGFFGDSFVWVGALTLTAVVHGCAWCASQPANGSGIPSAAMSSSMRCTRPCASAETFAISKSLKPPSS